MFGHSYCLPMIHLFPRYRLAVFISGKFYIFWSFLIRTTWCDPLGDLWPIRSMTVVLTACHCGNWSYLLRTFENDAYSLLVSAGIFLQLSQFLRGNVQVYRVIFYIALFCVESVDQILSWYFLCLLNHMCSQKYHWEFCIKTWWVFHLENLWYSRLVLVC